jgi:excisionase family DNA binding protein
MPNREDAMNTTLAPERETLTIAETAVVLGLSRNATYAAVERGDLPTVRIGGRILVSRARLRELLDGRPASSGEVA